MSTFGSVCLLSIGIEISSAFVGLNLTVLA